MKNITQYHLNLIVGGRKTAKQLGREARVVIDQAYGSGYTDIPAEFLQHCREFGIKESKIQWAVKWMQEHKPTPAKAKQFVKTAEKLMSL